MSGLELSPPPGGVPSLPIVEPGRTDDGRWLSKGRWLPLLVAVLVALATCLYGLDHKSLWQDEAFSVALARLDWADLRRVIVQDQTNMLLYHVVLHFWLKLGTNEFVARAPAAVFAIASIVPLYGLGRRLLGERPAAMAAMLMAVNAFFVHFAQEARGYSLVLLLTTTSSYLFLRAIENPSRRRWGLYIVISGLSMYAHFFGALVIASHALSLILNRRRPLALASIAMVYALIGLTIIPLAGLAWGTGHLEWITKPSLLDIRRLFLELSGGTRALLWVYFGACAIALTSTIPGRKAERQIWSNRVFLLLWLLLPVTTVFFVSVTLKPVFSDRYFIIMLPPLVLLAAAGLEVVQPLALKIGAFGVALALAIHGLLAWYAAPPLEDWRAASAYVLGAARQGDVVAFEAPYVRIPFEYYLRLRQHESPAPEPLYPTAPWGRLDILDPQISRGVNDWPVGGNQNAPRLWVVQSHIIPPVSVDQAPQRVPQKIREQYRLVDDRRFRGVRVFRWEQDGRPDNGSVRTGGVLR